MTERQTERQEEIADAMHRYGAELVKALDDELPDWVRRSVASILERQGIEATPEVVAMIEEAADDAVAQVRERLQPLLDADLDRQATTPLSIVRAAVQFPTEVLVKAGAEPVPRDEYAEHQFPHDLYDLTPANLAEVGSLSGDAGIAWGAAKAMGHRLRHEGGR